MKMRFKIIGSVLLHYLAVSWSMMRYFGVTNKLAVVHQSPQDKKPNAIYEDSKTGFAPKIHGNEANIDKEDTFFEKTNMRNSFGRDAIIITNLISNISYSGAQMLENLQDHINNNIQLSSLPSILHILSNDYEDSIEACMDIMLAQMVKCELEREFYTIDFIDTTNKILANKSLELLNYTVSKASKTSSSGVLQDKVEKLSKYIEMAVNNEKKRFFEYICKNLNICRQFPGYSDHIADIIQEITVLPNSTFLSMLILLADIMETREDFFNTIMGIDTAFLKKMNTKLRRLTENIAEARGIFNTLKTIMGKRHQIYRSKNGEIKIRKKALRILIDLFDKSFEMVPNDLVTAEVSNVIAALKAWNLKSRNNDLQKILNVFLDNVEKGIELSLKLPELKIEVKTLIKILEAGHSKYIAMVDQDLFTKGSKYLRYGNYNFQPHT